MHALAPTPVRFLNLPTPLEVHLLPATATPGKALEALREAALLEEERLSAAVVRKGVPTVSARRVVRVVAVIIPLPQFCIISSLSRTHRERRQLVSCSPWLLKTSYASFKAAICSSVPPTSGCTVFAFVRLEVSPIHDSTTCIDKNSQSLLDLAFIRVSRDTQHLHKSTFLSAQRKIRHPPCSSLSAWTPLEAAVLSAICSRSAR
jgi:hypothetical protein